MASQSIFSNDTGAGILQDIFIELTRTALSVRIQYCELDADMETHRHHLAYLVHGRGLMSALVRSRSFSEFGGSDDQEQCCKNTKDTFDLHLRTGNDDE